MAVKAYLKAIFGFMNRHIGWPISAAWARLMAKGPRPPAFVGAYPDVTTARANVSKRIPNTYDDDSVAPINFDRMVQLQLWDYPVLLWIERLMSRDLSLLDCGGHFGTKHIAFETVLPLDRIRWTVYDLPATVRAARHLQDAGTLPASITFLDDLSQVDTPDILLASGLLQYLDEDFGSLIARLPAPPKHIILNKVATRDGADVVTLEKIGPGRVPFQIRNRASFEQNLKKMGYRIVDAWHIPSLSRTIATHPSLGASTSRGYYLEYKG